MAAENYKVRIWGIVQGNNLQIKFRKIVLGLPVFTNSVNSSYSELSYQETVI
jgi:hypothetical protein